MKRVVFTGIGFLILTFFCVMLFMRLERDSEDPVDISPQNADTEVEDPVDISPQSVDTQIAAVNKLINSLKKPKIPEGWSEDPWVKEFDEELAKEAALWEKELEKSFYDNIDSILAKKRSERSDADLAEIDSMLSKFESLESMSESDIIDTLLSFYPEDHIEGYRQIYIVGWRQGLIDA